jgi:hypothetical protein
LRYFTILGKGFGGKIKTQKTKYILLWMFVLCLLMMFFEQMSDMILIPCIVPLSIIIGDYISEIKQIKIANTLLVLFFGGFFNYLFTCFRNNQFKLLYTTFKV